MVNDELMKKVSDLMLESGLCFLRGQLMNIIMAEKSDNKEIYYLADLRVPRMLNVESVYDASFNWVHVCFGSEFVKNNNFTIDKMKIFKENEVLLNLRFSSSIYKYKNKDDETMKKNEIRFFVDDIILLNSNLKTIDFSCRKVISI